MHPNFEFIENVYLQMHQIAEFSQINGLVITPNTEGKQNIKLFLNNGKV